MLIVVYTYFYMGTIEQEKAPTLSVVDSKKNEAANFVQGRITALMRGEAISSLDAARRVYEEVRGNDYRQEQATAKLLELLTMRNEVDMRTEEIERTYPSLMSVIDIGEQGSATNDERYKVAA
jgi:hypothetical protein